MKSPSVLVGTLLSAVSLAASAASQQAPALPAVRESPAASVTQRIGLTDVTVSYHRPGVKGRTIFGGLVPYGELWRAGANENTTIAFSHDVTIEGKPLAAGTYGLHMIPRPDRWTIVFNGDHESWGSYFYREEADALRVDVTPEEAPSTEWLRYDFDDLTDSSATLSLVWAETAVPMHIAVDTNAVMLAYIDDVYLRGLAGFFPDGYMNAANWCLQKGVAFDKALAWVDTAAQTAGGATFDMLRTRSQLFEGMGKPREAEQALLAAFDVATSSDLAAYGRQLLRRGDAKGAATIFGMDAEKHPDAWDAHDGLGTALERLGQKEAAAKSYARALELVQDATQKARIEASLQRVSTQG
ncbi:MAG: DUF2911 domain-containing protein [Planctomycetes bacterium]|nr:DUF2911 domain-containing protein [Planctomycetota bacterium]